MKGGLLLLEGGGVLGITNGKSVPVLRVAEVAIGGDGAGLGCV